MLFMTAPLIVLKVLIHYQAKKNLATVIHIVCTTDILTISKNTGDKSTPKNRLLNNLLVMKPRQKLLKSKRDKR